MKRLVLTLVILASFALGGVAQSLNYNFDDGTLQGWTTIDADGDGHDWELSSDGMGFNNSEGMMMSYSRDYATGDSLTPCNYLVSPRVALTEAFSTIDFWACALDEVYVAEHFGVFISYDGIHDWTALQEWTMQGPRNWYNYTTDLSAYAGQEVYLAIRHYYSSGMSAICVDDIYIEGEIVEPHQYEPIVAEGKQWNVLFSYPWSPPEPQHMYTDIYKIEGDSLVDGVSYKVMYTTRNEDLTGWSVCGVIRETEDRQVLYRRDGSSYDEILYDFSMEVGDTIIMNGSGFYPDWMFVVETNEILINGEPRKQIVLEYSWGDQEVWIEGIGSLYGIIDSGSLFLMGGSTNLLCYYEDGDLVWQNTTPGYNECYMVYPTPPTPSQSFVEGWLEIPTGATENLYGVACLNEHEVVACGENGKILKTTNGGDSWTVKFEKEGYDMMHVAFANEQVGYACGDSCYWDVYHHKGIIVKTTDGGETWQELPNTNFVYLEHPDFQRTNDLFVVDAETFYLLTADNLLWKTTDGGQSFFCSASFEPLGRIVHCELYFKDETGYLVAINSDCVTPGMHIYKTTDSGQNWDEVYFNEYIDHTVATHFFDENHVELFGNFNLYQYNLMVTEDGFETVSYLHVATPIMTAYGFGNVSHSKFTSDTYGCVLMGMTLDKGSNETNPFILKDGWEHCEYIHVGIPYCYNDGVTHCRDLYDIDGIDTTFFIAAENGYIYKTAMIPLGGNNFLMGSEWYYEIQNENGSVTYQYMYQAGDTIVQDEPTHILVRINTLYDKGLRDEVTHEYVYKRNNKVYWWNKTLEAFTMLYDFEAEVGDEWEIKVGTESLIMHVDAVETVEYEGSFYRMLRVSDAGNIFSGNIVCGIGHLTSFFPERLMNNGDGLRVEGLRCYWVGDELVFKPGDEDCDAIYDELHGLDEDGPSTGSGALTVYPNPTNGVLFVETHGRASQLSNQTYRITNLMGQTVLSGNITAETQQIDVANLPEGMYFITFAGETLKFVVNK
ncbi:MAG: choice-of-anchor J domain-containing protein [Bacteroidales bacterium]|nr:choice-of-anchor J domain-containing protein [Bacteroidales bacterium]